MKNLTYIDKDENFAIALCKDNFSAIVVQLINYRDQLIPNEKNELTTHRSSVVLMQETVSLSDIIGSDFKDQVGLAISKVKKRLAQIKSREQTVDGVLNDYLSKHQELNKDDNA